MRRLQGVRNLQGPVEQGSERDGLIADAVGQGLSLEQLHSDEGTALIFVDFVDGADVGMIECGCGTGLAFETLEGMRVDGGVFWKELQSDQAAQTNVFGFVDHSHATRSKFFLDAVVRDNPVVHDTQHSDLQL